MEGWRSKDARFVGRKMGEAEGRFFLFFCCIEGRTGDKKS